MKLLWNCIKRLINRESLREIKVFQEFMWSSMSAWVHSCCAAQTGSALPPFPAFLTARDNRGWEWKRGKSPSVGIREASNGRCGGRRPSLTPLTSEQHQHDSFHSALFYTPPSYWSANRLNQWREWGAGLPAWLTDGAVFRKPVWTQSEIHVLNKSEWSCKQERKDQFVYLIRQKRMFDSRIKP